MKKNKKSLVTKILAVTIASLFGLEASAAGTMISANTVPLRATAPAKAAPKATFSNTPFDHYTTFGLPLKGGVQIDSKNQKITLNLVKSDLRQVLRMLADKAGKNIILDASVPGSSGSSNSNNSGVSTGTPTVSGGPDADGEISLDLVNVTVNKAFEYIMTLKELTYWQDGNTVIVATSDRAEELGLNKTEIKSIKIKYVDAQKIADFLNSNIFSLNKPDISKAAIVTCNPNTNEIYLFGKEHDYQMAVKIVSRLDVKPQVNTFSVNYAKPADLASKICMTVFQNTSASSTSSSSSSSSSSSGSSSSGGSRTTTVCSGNGTSGSSGSSSSSSSGGSSSLSSFSSPSYMVLADTGLNQITIFGGTQEQINLAKEIIKNFDKKEPQVYLEISIIELSEDGSKAFNNILYYTNAKSVYKQSAGLSRLEYTLRKTIDPYVSAVEPVYTNLDTYGNFDDTFGAIQTVITSGKGRILANPRILASNNTESTINIKEDIVSNVTTNVVQGASTTSSTTAQHGDVGINLTVTPQISPNGYVTLDLKPSYSSVKGDDGYGGTLTRTRDFEAKQVRVKDGETLIIAGLIQETENISHKKTPVLADIPILGTLFKDQSTAKSRSELIFMITPRVIKDNETM